MESSDGKGSSEKRLQQFPGTNLLRGYWLFGFIVAWIVPSSFGKTVFVERFAALFTTVDAVSAASFDPGVYRGYFFLAFLAFLTVLPILVKQVRLVVRPIYSKMSVPAVIAVIIVMIVFGWLIYASLWGMANHLPDFVGKHYDQVQWRQRSFQSLYRFLLNSRLGLAVIGSTYLYGLANIVAMQIIILVGLKRLLF